MVITMHAEHVEPGDVLRTGAGPREVSCVERQGLTGDIRIDHSTGFTIFGAGDLVQVEVGALH